MELNELFNRLNRASNPTDYLSRQGFGSRWTRTSGSNLLRDQGYGAQIATPTYASIPQPTAPGQSVGSVGNAGIRSNFNRSWGGDMDFPTLGAIANTLSSGDFRSSVQQPSGRVSKRAQRKAQQAQTTKQNYANAYAGQGGWYGQAYQQNLSAAQQAQTSQKAQQLAQQMMGGYTGDIDPFGSAYRTAAQEASSREASRQSQEDLAQQQRQQKVMGDVYAGEDYRSVYESSARESTRRRRAQTPVARPEPAWKAVAEERDPSAPPPGAPDLSRRSQRPQQPSLVPASESAAFAGSSTTTTTRKRTRQPAGGNPRALGSASRDIGKALAEMSQEAQERNAQNM